jgi:hypothetical protein
VSEKELKAYGVNNGRFGLLNRKSIDNGLMMAEEHSLIGGWENHPPFIKGITSICHNDNSKEQSIINAKS